MYIIHEPAFWMADSKIHCMIVKSSLSTTRWMNEEFNNGTLTEGYCCGLVSQNLCKYDELFLTCCLSVILSDWQKLS